MAGAKPVFETRRIGETDLRITTLGLGGATLAGMRERVPPEEARATVSAALDAGITYFDTAPRYGTGLSERLMGDVLRDRRAGTVLSTKVGRLLKPLFGPRPADFQFAGALPFEEIFDYSYDAIMRSFEDSQQRLGLNKIDILYVHDIGVGTHGVEGNQPFWKQLETGGYKALEELKRSGQISAFGLGVNEWEVLMDAFELGDWDVFLLAGRYTLLEQTSLNPFLSTCIKRKASVVAAAPFNSGILVGGTTWNYVAAPQDVLDRVRAIETICADFNVPLPAAALQFPLTHPAVCTVLPGPRSPQELEGILGWWQVNIPDGFWSALADKGLLSGGTPLPGGQAV
ncbi:aldo/keto reductase [Paradevosia shaoguanensis]|uniref:aldo/keto reductase n=1 Tax=Paradevosia shaoguanensis TaxID=1335043 RepID=UPI001931A515|nr:aldo/keto reductase [Paradevosia shaoguanensis]